MSKNNHFRAVQALLDEAKAILIRHNKHLVYRLPNGRTITISATPSDPNVVWEIKRLLRQALR